MSKDAVKQMFGKIEKDPSLKGKYVELMRAHQNATEKALTNKLVEFGKTAGFAFSKDDLLAARAEVMDKANSNKELAEEDLEKVAGGSVQGRKCAATVVSIFTVGIGCAIESVGAELLSSRGCAGTMTTSNSNTSDCWTF